jgi:glycosyltransferase involved in cell wall biosynthesis
VQENSEVLQQADVIYERDAFQSFGTQRVASRIDTPWVLECNGFFWEEQSPLPSPVSPDRYRRRHVEKWKAADQLIVVSESFKQRVVQEGVVPEKISVIQNAVNLAPYRAVSASEVEAFRNEWELSETAVIGFLGHMLPWHRIDLFVDAIGALHKSGYNVQGLLVGGGRWKKYRTYAEQAGVAEQIVFSGPVPPEDVPEAVAAMDICAVPGSNEYGSPVKLFDYGAAGRPVVAANAPSVTEVITDEKNGLLFEEGSLEGFVEALSRLIEDDKLRDRIARTFREKIEEEHTWEKVGQRTECVLNRVLDAPRS